MDSKSSGTMLEFGSVFAYSLITIICVNLLFLLIRKKKPTSTEVAQSVGGSMARLGIYCIEFVVGTGFMLCLLRGLPEIIATFTNDFAIAHTLGTVFGVILGWMCFVLFRKARRLIFEKCPTQLRAWSIYLAASMMIIYLLYFV